ncbi:MAG TPA: hypothetical protein V6D48_18795 [Oculatellaceae cyanobacterium]
MVATIGFHVKLTPMDNIVPLPRVVHATENRYKGLSNGDDARLNLLYGVIPFWIWDARILKALPVGSFRNSNVANLNPNGINGWQVRRL